MENQIGENKSLCKKLLFSVGQTVKVSGKNGLFRYIKNNIVREISTGKILSVKYSDMKKLNFFDKLFKKK